MNHARTKYYKALFLIAAIYDILLGIVFTFFYTHAFQLLGIKDKLPQYGGYISLIGAFLLVIGIAYYLIFIGDLQKNKDLVTVGLLYKLAYSATAIYYFAFGDVPHIAFVVVFGFLDIIFLILMLECRIFIGKNKT